MRSRITRAIVGVTAAVLIALSIPLVVVARRNIINGEVVELQASAARALTEITPPLDTAEMRAIAEEADAPPPFAVYRPDGKRIFGIGPATADAGVRRALGGLTVSTRSETEIVVSTPITDPDTEEILGALRISESLDGTDGRATVALLSIIGAGGIGILVAWVFGRRLARRLSDPVVELAGIATRLGRGEILDDHDPVGIAEVDLLGDALVGSSRRVAEALARERQFSADVSHQLRTPLTGLRLRLEAAVEHDSLHDVDVALEDLHRLEDTVQHILTYARDQIPTSSVTGLGDAVARAADRWTGRAAGVGRTVDASIAADATVRAAPTSIDQVLDVLLDNALRHGTGHVEVAARPVPGGAAIEVRDEGTSADRGTDEEIFSRGHGSQHGIGLAFARSLAEAEGGRLLRTSSQPTTFCLVLLAAEP